MQEGGVSGGVGGGCRGVAPSVKERARAAARASAVVWAPKLPPQPCASSHWLSCEMHAALSWARYAPQAMSMPSDGWGVGLGVGYEWVLEPVLGFEC